MKSGRFTRRGFLQSTTLAAALAGPQAGTSAAAEQRHRTQFDAQLLAESFDPLIAVNHGRQVQVTAAGEVLTALAWGGANPRVRVYKDRAVAEEYSLRGVPSAPVLTGGHVLYSAGATVYRGREPWPGITGTLLDAVTAPDGSPILALVHDGRLTVAGVKVDDGVGRASIELDAAGALHVAYEKRQGIEYRVYEKDVERHSERVAEAYGSHPVLLAHKGAIILAWLGESCRVQGEMHGSDAWERLGRGGYIAALVRREGKWRRHELVQSRQLVKALYPTDGAYGGGNDRALITAMEEFGPPALGVGSDGVAHILWPDITRRWIYGVRLLGDEFSAPHEVRGPLEQLTGPCLIPRHAAADTLAMVTRTRVYLDRIALPSPAISHGRRIDFLTPDHLAHSSGLELQVNPMRRRPENPIIALDPPGGTYDSAIVPNVFHDAKGWRAELMYIVASKADPNTTDRGWRFDGLAASDDGIRWKKLPPSPLETRFRGAVPKFSVRAVEDPAEANPAHRFKGLMRSPDHEPWGYIPVVSADGVNWERVPNPRTVVRADDDLRIWIDAADIPSRRFKANGIGRSFCGRTSVQYTSANGIEWDGERDTLDFNDPFRSRADRASTGRILLDSWSGPMEEDEIHGGFVFREGDRWPLHYMKWTADGHIYCGLASSRDALNFSRVAGGAVTLPLGDAGTWDAGRIALREAPFRVGDMWRQYYTGSGWKHGMGGVGARTSHFGLNAPNQVGAAEIRVGRWVHLQTRRDVDTGEVGTTVLRLARPHSLKLDAEGGGIQVSVHNPATGREHAGFGYAQFDPPRANGLAAWHGRGLETLGAQALQLYVRITGPRAKLYGLELV
jgi:hypothetical protein